MTMRTQSDRLIDEQVQRFHRDGFLNAGMVLSEAEVLELGDALAAVIAKGPDGFAGVKPHPVLFHDMAATRDGEGNVVSENPNYQIVNIWQCAEPFRRLLWHPLVIRAISQLTGFTDLQIWHDQVQYKPAKTGGSTPWHQDEAYWQEDKLYQELSVWFALQKTTEKMGCMQFIAGSHRGEVRPHHPWKNDPKIIALEVDADCVDATLAVACPLHAGAATVHSARTLHYTSGNRTDEPRRALIFTVGTPPAQRDQPRNFYWNQKERDYKKECLDRGVRQ
ncbi:MAG: phytanoyl-CoA dioxygenase family protein [Phycisphaeraceae bacterium]|nr:phytanoyl-CoA dioxygenase family protein [Phycisphaeraceae bacterium]